MYARVSIKRSQGKTYRYLQLCEAYRNAEGKPRTKVMANFGRIDQLDRKKVDTAINALLQYASNPSLPRLSDVDHGPVRDYGDMLSLVHLWGRLRLTESINRCLKESKVAFDVGQMIQVMVLNRLSDPLSKLGIMRWLPTVYIPDLKSDQVQYQHLLRAMDYLIESKEQIERDLYNQLITLFSPDVDLVFYDLTSSYFEGEGPDLAEYGYSRDQRQDRVQMVIALVVSREGLPIYHEVLPGNTADVSTLKDTVDILSSRFNIRQTVFVCDRGLVSQENIEKLDEMGFPYIIGLRARNNDEVKALYQKNLSGFEADPALDGLLVKETRQGGLRYVQCHNPEVAKTKKTRRDRCYAEIQKTVAQLEKRFRSGRLSREALHHQILRLLEDRHMAKYFDPRIEGDRVILYMRKEVWERETYLDGKFFLKTNMPQEKITTAEVVRSYKELQTVERAFRELKDFLRIRPVYHYTDSRVKAHVFICVLAYLLEKMVDLYCQRAALPHTARRALSMLSRLKTIECRLNDQAVTMSNHYDEEVARIFEALGVPKPVKIIQNQ